MIVEQETQCHQAHLSPEIMLNSARGRINARNPGGSFKFPYAGKTAHKYSFSHLHKQILS